MQVTPSVHIIRNLFVNSYLIEDDDSLTLVDADFTRSGHGILRVIGALGHEPHDVRRILITHCDGDHVGGLAALQGVTGAAVYASPLEAAALAAGKASRELKHNTIAGKLAALAGIAFRFTPSTAAVSLADGDVLPVLGGLHVLATPGHTPQHVSFYSPSTGVLFTGDSIITRRNRLVVWIGANTWDETRARDSARRQVALGARIICPGHGSVVADPSATYIV